MNINKIINLLKRCLIMACVAFYISACLASEQPYKIDTSSIETQNFVMLQYHHVATDTPAVTSISPKDFASHMAHLKENHTVISLEEALSSIKNKTPLPDKSVVITFDDGYINILENAHPILEKYDFPYTIFINPAIIGDTPSQLSWEQVKSMQPLVTFANHTLDHIHLLTRYDNESESKWLARAMKDIKQAEELMTEKLGYSKKWIAYPYGEFNNALKSELEKEGYIGFGQQSGAVSFFSDFGALPRFPAAGIYASLNSLKTKLNSLAMPVEVIYPTNTEFSLGERIQNIELEVLSDDVQMSNFACYFKGQPVEISKDGARITAKINHTLTPGRARVNCTAPSNRLRGRFYWYSVPMFTPTETGEYLD